MSLIITSPEAVISEKPVISFENVSKSFSGQNVLTDVSLDFSEGKIHALIGESGSGKTTCLRIMNALTPHTSGRVVFQGQELDPTKGPLLRRKMGYAQQGNSLFPHLSIYENLTIIAKRIGWSEADMKARAEELLQNVRLDADEVLGKMPSQLSGGMQQRVGIARSLFTRPKLLLMDEPFGALDPLTRDEIQALFLELHKKHQFTAILVTHDMPEAFRLGDTLTLLNEGRVEQSGPPSELVLEPASDMVAKFVQSHSPVGALESISVWSVMRRKDLENLKLDGEVLNEQSNLLDAMVALANNSGQPVPIVNKNRDIVGRFDREALDAL